MTAAKAQQRAMNATVTASISSWYVGLQEKKELSELSFVLELLDDGGGIAEIIDTEDNNIQKTTLQNIAVQCEDFGQSIAMPHYGYQQLRLEYFNSKLTMHEFVVAAHVSNTNMVYFYDERVLKRTGRVCAT